MKPSRLLPPAHSSIRWKRGSAHSASIALVRLESVGLACRRRAADRRLHLRGESRAGVGLALEASESGVLAPHANATALKARSRALNRWTTENSSPIQSVAPVPNGKLQLAVRS